MDFASIQLYQAVVTIVAGFMLYQGIENYMKGKASQTFLKLLVRIVVWGGMAVVALFPNATNLIADIIGLEGNINAVILTGFILVFLIIFKLLSAIERLEQQISELTRTESLKQLNKNIRTTK